MQHYITDIILSDLNVFSEYPKLFVPTMLLHRDDVIAIFTNCRLCKMLEFLLRMFYQLYYSHYNVDERFKCFLAV